MELQPESAEFEQIMAAVDRLADSARQCLAFLPTAVEQVRQLGRDEAAAGRGTW